MRIPHGDDQVNDLPSLQRARRVLAGVRPVEPTPGCLDHQTIAALAEGSLTGDACRDAVAHLAGCAPCRRSVASAARALADPAIAREVRRLDGAGHRRVYRVALPLAAAAGLVLLLVRPGGRHPVEPTHRALTVTPAPAPVPLAPLGVVPEARLLRWNAVPSADRYRVTLFDAGASLLFETDVSSPTAALPESVVLAPGARYLWKVEARTGFDRWSASELVEFSIARGPPR